MLTLAMNEWALILGLTVVVTLVGIYCSKRKDFRRFLFALLALWVAGSVAWVSSVLPGSTDPKWLVSVAPFIVLSIPTAIYALMVGPLVSKGVGFGLLTLLAFTSTVLALFLSMLAGLYVSCYWFHDCP